jgi:hypothetical protein
MKHRSRRWNSSRRSKSALSGVGRRMPRFAKNHPIKTGLSVIAGVALASWIGKALLK